MKRLIAILSMLVLTMIFSSQLFAQSEEKKADNQERGRRGRPVLNRDNLRIPQENGDNTMLPPRVERPERSGERLRGGNSLDEQQDKEGIDPKKRGKRQLNGGNHFERKWESLNLTEAQQTRLNTLKEDFQKAMRSRKDQLQKINSDSREAFKKEDFRQMRRLSDQKGKITAEMSKLRIDYLENISKTLTPEQKEKFKESRK